MKRAFAVALVHVRSMHNVGSIFRTADAAGVSKIFLVGVTPAPLDRFGRTRKAIAKTALGAETYVPWEHVASFGRLAARLRREGWRIVGVEQDTRAKDYRDLKPRGKTLFVFGSEVNGLSRAERAACDDLIEIPMRGRKESLNVSVAAGVVLFECVVSR